MIAAAFSSRVRPTHAARVVRTGAAAALPAGVLPVVALLTGACRGETPSTPPLPPPAVTVVSVVERRLEEPVDFVGTVDPSRRVDVRAQVSGIIVERPFREGTTVRAGDVLYRIDPALYDADWRAARGRRAQAEAQFANATGSAARLRPLLADNAVARQEVDDAEAAARGARGGLDDARAAVDRARKSLSETVVRAEITGRVGRAVLERGARITGPGDVLTTLDVVDPVYVSFRPSAEQQLRWKRDPASRAAVAPGGTARVQVVLADSVPLAETPGIAYVDPVIDSLTGTQQYRATFANAERLLVPGQFVRVRLLGLARERAIVIPQRAVVQELGQQSVYVLTRGDTVRVREVVATAWAGGDWLIERGLAAGERVVVDGCRRWPTDASRVRCHSGGGPPRGGPRREGAAPSGRP
jgi:membrane fusion protein (multidrug efflux system)